MKTLGNIVLQTLKWGTAWGVVGGVWTMEEFIRKPNVGILGVFAPIVVFGICFAFGGLAGLIFGIATSFYPDPNLRSRIGAAAGFAVGLFSIKGTAFFIVISVCCLLGMAMAYRRSPATASPGHGPI